MIAAAPPQRTTPPLSPADIERATVLIVDDEREIRVVVAAALDALGMRALEAATAATASAIAATENPDLYLLDLGLPDRSGMELCAELRLWTSAPIIVLSARHDERDKVALLRAGADDYVSKPFGMTELVARIEAQLRRAKMPHRKLPPAFELDGLRIDLVKNELRRGSVRIRLSPTEWGIFSTLVMWGGRPVPHQEMFNAVWGRQFGNPSQYLRVYVTHLRRKIERDAAMPRVILTEPGVGYRLGID
jgi:two-component system KDP operon response regulator KdpE